MHTPRPHCPLSVPGTRTCPAARPPLLPQSPLPQRPRSVGDLKGPERSPGPAPRGCGRRTEGPRAGATQGAGSQPRARAWCGGGALSCTTSDLSLGETPRGEYRRLHGEAGGRPREGLPLAFRGGRRRRGSQRRGNPSSLHLLLCLPAKGAGQGGLRAPCLGPWELREPHRVLRRRPARPTPSCRGAGAREGGLGKPAARGAPGTDQLGLCLCLEPCLASLPSPGPSGSPHTRPARPASGIG